MTAAWLALALLSALGFYLSIAHQRLWLRARGHAGLLRWLACACAVAACASAIAALGVTAGVSAALSAIMLVAVLLPYLDAWRQARGTRREARHVG